MDYYTFYDGIKQVISQNEYSRMIIVKWKKMLIIVDEYEYKGNWEERGRMRITKEEIKRLSEMI